MKNNKLMALFVLAIFVISLVPMAIAEEGTDADSNTELETQSDVHKDGDSTLGLRERLRLRQNVLERKADIIDDKMDVLERRAELVKDKVALLERHRQQIADLVKMCQEKGVSAEECKRRFEHRLRNLDNLPENFKERLAEFEARKADRNQEIQDLENDKDFGKHMLKLKFKTRVVAEAKLEEARKNFIKARLEFKESKARLENARSRLDTAKKLEKACKDPDSEDCKTAKAELLAAAKEHFSAQADHIIETLEKIKSRVQGNEDLTDEEEAKITVALDAELKIVTDIKVKINAAENKEQLLQAARELKDAWNRIRHVAKRYAAFVVSSRMAGIIVQSKHLEKKLERVLARMAENGQNTSEVQALVDDFNKEIEAARTSFKASQTLWLAVKLDVKADVETNATVQQAQEKLKESREHLKKARDLLRQIVTKVDKNALKDADEEEESESASHADENDSNEDDESTEASADTSANGSGVDASAETSVSVSV